MDNNNQNMMQNAQTSQPQQNAQPQQYQAQPQQYQAQQPQYQAQPPQYQAQQPQYQAQQPQYQAQQPQYQAQPPQYQAQQPQYQAQQPYGQQPYGQQPYGQPYVQHPKAPKQGNMANGFKNVIGSFKSVFDKKGISLFWLAGIVAAMMFIFAPFMNIAAIHVNQKVASDDVMDIGDFNDYMDGFGNYSIKLKAADGFTMFELSKLGGTVDGLIDTAIKLAGPYGSMISKDMLVDSLDMIENEMDDYLEDFEDDYSMKIRKSSINEVFGTLHLVLKGRAALLITPFVLILCGIGMFLFTLINKKVAKIVCSSIPVACLLWIMLCSSHFFSIMGIGAWVILVAAALGIVSAIMDKSAC